MEGRGLICAGGQIEEWKDEGMEGWRDGGMEGLRDVYKDARVGGVCPVKRTVCLFVQSDLPGC